MPGLSALSQLRDTAPHKDDNNVLMFQKNGFVIFVGRNAFSNEKLISEHPHRECLWLHAMAARGSHVILCIHDKQDPEELVIQYAASIALKNSNSEARTVCMGLLKDVYKPEGGGMGVWKPSKRALVEVA